MKNEEDYCCEVICNGKELFFQLENIIIIGDINLHDTDESVLKSYEEIFNSIYFMYKKKGERFVEDLNGEFSFVLFDILQKKLYCVRDQIGIKTLFWIEKKEEVIIASDISLLEEEVRQNALNKDYFIEFYIQKGTVDSEITPYRNISRVPSGCYLKWTDWNRELKNYWDLSTVQDEIRYKNSEEYEEGFYDLLSSSVKRRLKKGKNFVMLSGGMDSTSIYSIAKKASETTNLYSLSSVSAVFEELKDCDEREYIELLFEKYNEKGEYIFFDDKLMFDNFPYSFPFSYEPYVSSLTYDFTSKLIEGALEQGADNILSGFAGDHLLTGSLYMIKDLMKEKKYKKAFSILTDYSIISNSSAFKNLINYAILPKIKNNYLMYSDRNCSKALSEKINKIKFNHQKNLYLQIKNAKAHLYTDRVIGGEKNVSIKHPFLDKNLIEYIYKIPGDELMDSDQNKKILRNAMKKELPMPIISRINKTTHLSYTYKSITKNWSGIYSTMSNPVLITELKLITASEWQKLLHDWRNGLNVGDKFWILFSIELWYIQYSTKLNPSI